MTITGKGTGKGDRKVDSKPRYDRKNPHDRRGVEGTKLPDHELRMRGVVEEKAVEDDAAPSSVVKSAQVRAAEKVLGIVGDAPTSKPGTAGAKTALAGMGMFERAKQKLKRGTLVALTGLMIFNAGAQAFNAPYAPGPHTTTQQVRMLTGATTSVQNLRMGQWALSDAQQVLSRWQTEAQAAAQSGAPFEVTKARAAELVSAALLPDKAPAGVDVFAYAKTKLGTDTQQLIATLVDGAAFTISADAKEHLSLALGRAHAVSADGLVTVTGDQSGGLLRLTGQKGAQVEVLNLSTIPTQRIHPDETFVLGSIADDGTFKAPLPMNEGDVIRLRVKLPSGQISEWVDFKATGVGVDTRQAEVALFRVGLKPNADGTIAVSNINPSRPVSEPGAVMRFVNTRTNDAVDVTFDKNGTFPAGTKLVGQIGDKFSIRVTDGVHDKELAREISVLTVRDGGKPVVFGEIDLKDPTLHKDELDAEGKPMFSLERYRGPLFEDGAQFTDAVQGQIGDCYFPAAISAIAFHKPGTFEKIMQMKEEIDPDSGARKVWYEVTFKERDWNNGGAFKDVTRRVDGDLYIRSWGGPLYGADDGARTPEDMELWFAILEKAYAEWKGESYEAIGNGGMVSQVFEDILGAEASSMGTWDADGVWDTIKSAVDDKRPIGAGTHGESQEALYANTGVYANHAYSVIGYEVKDGVKYVQLRNPWGESEPYPGDGKNDGIFTLKLEQFQKLYANLYVVDKAP